MGLKVECAHTRGHVGVMLVRSNNSVVFVKFPYTEPKYKKEKIEPELNLIQSNMYYKLVQGIKYYTPEQLEGFDDKSIARIKRDHKIAKGIIVTMKKRIYFKAADDLFFSIFPQYKNDPEFKKGSIPKGYTLNRLGITKRQVCEEFIKAGLLPTNFFELTVENLEL